MEVVIKSNSTFDWTRQLETDPVDIHYYGDDFSPIKPYYSNVIRLCIFQSKALDRMKSLEEIQILKIKGSITDEIVDLIQISLCLTEISWVTTDSSKFKELKILKEFSEKMNFNRKRNFRLVELSSISK